jgi:hypothetical protein
VLFLPAEDRSGKFVDTRPAQASVNNLREPDAPAESLWASPATEPLDGEMLNALTWAHSPRQGTADVAILDNWFPDALATAWLRE